MPKINCIRSIFISSSQASGVKRRDARAARATFSTAATLCPSITRLIDINYNERARKINITGESQITGCSILPNRTEAVQIRPVTYRITSTGSSCRPTSPTAVTVSSLRTHRRNRLRHPMVGEFFFGGVGCFYQACVFTNDVRFSIVFFPLTHTITHG